MKTDFSYTTGDDGLVSILPNTPEAEREYNRIFAESGSMRLMPWEFDAFRKKARSAGYSVRKQEPANARISAEDLARLLEHGTGSVNCP